LVLVTGIEFPFGGGVIGARGRFAPIRASALMYKLCALAFTEVTQRKAAQQTKNLIKLCGRAAAVETIDIFHETTGAFSRFPRN